jgi:hypothetical protein
MESSQGQAWLRSIGVMSSWLDHLTEQVLPESTHAQYTAWHYKPGFAHWLEMGWARKPIEAGLRAGHFKLGEPYS